MINSVFTNRTIVVGTKWMVVLGLLLTCLALTLYRKPVAGNGNTDIVREFLASSRGREAIQTRAGSTDFLVARAPLTDREVDLFLKIDGPIAIEIADTGESQVRMVTTKQLAKFANIKDFYKLTLTDILLSREDVEQIARIDSLRYLRLDNCGIDDEAAAILRGMKNLRMVDSVSNETTSVGDDLLKHLGSKSDERSLGNSR